MLTVPAFAGMTVAQGREESGAASVIPAQTGTWILPRRSSIRLLPRLALFLQLRLFCNGSSKPGNKFLFSGLTDK